MIEKIVKRHENVKINKEYCKNDVQKTKRISEHIPK